MVLVHDHINVVELKLVEVVPSEALLDLLVLADHLSGNLVSELPFLKGVPYGRNRIPGLVVAWWHCLVLRIATLETAERTNHISC